MTVEVRARIGEPKTNLAEEQGCSCLAAQVDCLVHGDIDAYVVELTYYGKKKLWTIGHSNSYLCIPIRTQIRFFESLYRATAEWSIGQSGVLETRIFRKSRFDNYVELTGAEIQARDQLAEQLELETAGT